MISYNLLRSVCHFTTSGWFECALAKRPHAFLKWELVFFLKSTSSDEQFLNLGTLRRATE